MQESILTRCCGGQQVRISRATRESAQLSTDKVSERSNVCKIHRSKLLNTRTGWSYNKERVISVGVRFVVISLGPRHMTALQA